MNIALCLEIELTLTGAELLSLFQIALAQTKWMDDVVREGL